jgi:hypothetical protein
LAGNESAGKLWPYQTDGQTAPDASPFLDRVVIDVGAGGQRRQGRVYKLPDPCKQISTTLRRRPKM